MPRKSSKMIETVKQLQNAPPGEYRVSGCPGLLLIVSRNINRSWVLRYLSPRSGSPRKMGLGAYPTVSLAVAGERARVLDRLILSGLDPLFEKAKQASELSVGDLAERWLEIHAEPQLRSHREYRRILERYVLPKIGNIKARVVSRSELLAITDELSVRGVDVQANRVLMVMRALFNWGKSRDFIDQNPADGLRKNREYARTRVLTMHEVAQFWIALEQLPFISSTTRRASQLQILTACRSSEILGAAKDEFDIGNGLWRIPAERTKSGLLHELPLSKPALEIVAESIAATNDSDWLFPSVNGPVRRDTIKTQLLKLVETIGMQHWVPHDLRRTAATWMGDKGYSTELIARILNHSRQGVTQRHYIHARMIGPMQEALDVWASAVAIAVADERNKQAQRGPASRIT